MNFYNLYNLSEQYSKIVLTKFFVETENPLGDFFNNILFRLPDWTFILIATVVSAMVSVKLERTFRNKQRIIQSKLIREAFSESLLATFSVLIWALLFFIGLAFLYFSVHYSMIYSSTITLIVLIAGIIFLLLEENIKK